jgi:hypothetical protein
MKIEFDFRADMTVCELVQYLCDELEIQSRSTDNYIAKCAEGRRTDTQTWCIKQHLRRETKLMDLIDDIQMYATFVDRELV